MSKFRNRTATLVAALAAVGATAWAADELVDLNKDPIMAQVESSQPAATPAPEATEPATVSEPTAQRAEPAIAPAASTPGAVSQPPILVEERRLSPDERIQAEVMDRLANATNISGRIGVESNDAVVTLTGSVLFGSHVDRAGRYARDVEGVKYVQNELRSQISRW